MLPYIIAVVILTVIGAFGVLFLRRFTIIKVNRISMFPTLKDGQIRFLDRKFTFDDLGAHNINSYTNRIYVYQSPSGMPVIKRLIYISYTASGIFLWFEGDNKDHSEDSRHYGFIEPEDVYGELVTDYKTFWRRLFTM